MKLRNFLTSLFIILMIIPINISALTVGDTFTGKSETVGSCKSGLVWCFQNRTGVRISLYKYIDGKLTYYASKDIDSAGNFQSKYSEKKRSLNNFSAYYTNNAAGKIAYQKAGYKVSWSKKAAQLKMDSSDIVGNSKVDTYSDANFNGYVKDYLYNKFKLETVNKEKIRNAINTFFGTSITNAQLSYLYVTAEPTYLVINRNKSVQYYGTAYELLFLPGSDSKGYYGINGLVFNQFSTLIYSQKPQSTDYNSFIPNVVEPVTNMNGLYSYDSTNYTTDCNNEYKKKTGKTTSTPATCRNANLKELKTNKGYGVGIVWIGEKLGCSDSCAAYDLNSENRLKCAEKVCSDDSANNTKSKKESCIRTCGYNPSDYTCSKSSTIKTTTTKCGSTRKKSRETCAISSNGYFKTVCIETTQIDYPNLSASMYLNENKSFSSKILTNGNKKCVKSFNYKLFQLDYASETKKDSKEKLEEVLNGSYFKNTDVNSKDLQYDKSSDKWQIKTINNDGKAKTLKWKVSSSSNEILNDKTKKRKINFYSNGKKTQSTKQYNYYKQYVSKVNGIIQLDSSLLYESNVLGTKSIITEIKRETSNLHDKSTCNYKIKENTTPDETLYCSGTVVNSSVAVDGTKTSNIKFIVSYKTKAGKDAEEVNHTNLKGKLTYAFDGGSKQDFEINKTELDAELYIPEGTSSIKTLEITSIDTNETFSCSVEDSAEERKTCTIDMQRDYSKGKVTLDVVTKGEVKSIECVYSDSEFEFSLKNKGGKRYEGNIDNILSEENPTAQISCEATLNNGNKCDSNFEIGSCKYIPPAKVDKVVKFCEESALLAGYGGSDPTEACKSDCAACPKNEDGSDYNREDLETWCVDNYAKVGYVDQYACMSGCGPSFSNSFVFRPITLGISNTNPLTPYNAFPSRSAGTNWVELEHKTVDNVFDKPPIYTIELDSKSIAAIKKDTRSIIKINNNNRAAAYLPYELKDEQGKLEKYTSAFIRSGLFCIDIDGDRKGCDG